MGAARKLQGEIDRVLKKVNEGLEDFDSIWEKVHDTENANQKEKYEADLKKEIKKLQRLRDQIKTWISSADIKDKTALVDARKAIENEMERFKVCEKEAKTKAFSKAALGAAVKADPKETQREAARDWLSSTVENVNLKIEELEYEAAQLQENQGKKKGGKAMSRYHEIEGAMQKYQSHTVRLEQCLRCLDNDTVAPEEVMDLKDTLDLLISPEEGCEAEESYDAVDDYYGELLERLDVVDMHVPSVAAASHAKHKHKEARAGRGVKGTAAGAAGAGGAGSLEAVAEAEEEGGSGAPVSPAGNSGKDKERAAAAAVKAQLIAAGNTSVKLQDDEDRKQRAAAAANGAPPPSPQAAPPAQPQRNAAAAAGPQQQQQQQQHKEAEDAAGPPSPLRIAPVPPAAPAAAAGPPQSPVDDTRQAAANTNGQLPSPSQQPSPQQQPQQPQPQQQLQQQQQQQQQQQPRPGAPNPQPAAGAPPRTGPPGAWNAVAAAGVKGPQQQQQKAGGPQPGPGVAPPGANHVGLHPDGPDVQQQQQQQGAGASLDGVAAQLGGLSVADRAASGPLPPHQLGVVQAPQAPVGVAAAQGQGAGAQKGAAVEAVVQQQRPGELQLGQAPPSMVASHALIIMEGCTSRAMHQLSDTDYNSKRFKARHVVPLPPSYPRTPPEILDNPGLFRKMDPEALFFAFYYQPDTYQQYLSAQELKRQSWRYHKTHNAWFQRYAEPSVTTEEYEQGTYVYFDYNIMHDDMQTGWCYRRKENFTFRYDALEDELQATL